MPQRAYTQNARWRKQNWNQDLYHLDSVVRGRLTIVDNDPSTIKVSFEQSAYHTLDWWESVGDLHCIDFGQNWWITDVRSKVAALKKEVNGFILEKMGRPL
jgi:hypothetical protein